MPTPLELAPTDFEALAALEPIVERMQAVTPYDGLVRSAQLAMIHGKPTAWYVPAVELIVRSALDMVALPSARERSPKEIIERSVIAGMAADKAAAVLINGGFMINFYTQHPLLSQVPLTKPMERALTEPIILPTLAKAPFHDASMLGGGALRFLRQQQAEGDHAQIVGRSSGLLAFSGISKRNDRASIEFIGYPYAQPDRFEYATDDRTVQFTRATRDLLRTQATPESGCPAGYAPSPYTPGTSILQDYWSEITAYLLPPDATMTYADFSADTPTLT